MLVSFYKIGAISRVKVAFLLYQNLNFNILIGRNHTLETQVSQSMSEPCYLLSLPKELLFGLQLLLDVSSIDLLNQCSKLLTKVLKESAIWENLLKSKFNVINYELCKINAPREFNCPLDQSFGPRQLYYHLFQNRTFERFCEEMSEYNQIYCDKYNYVSDFHEEEQMSKLKQIFDDFTTPGKSFSDVWYDCYWSGYDVKFEKYFWFSLTDCWFFPNGGPDFYRFDEPCLWVITLRKLDPLKRGSWTVISDNKKESLKIVSRSTGLKPKFFKAKLSTHLTKGTPLLIQGKLLSLQ